jgi:hypothetical protein
MKTGALPVSWRRMTSERSDRLRQFFAGYFNQDWDISGATRWSEVVDEYLAENPRDDVIRTREGVYPRFLTFSSLRRPFRDGPLVAGAEDVHEVVETA